MVKFGAVVNNANLVERDPEANGVERIVGLEHIDPENLHVRRWNSVADGTSFTRKFVPGQTLFGKRRAYQHKVAYAEFEGICSGDILTFEPKNRKVLLPELLPFICQSDAFFNHALDTSAGSLSPRTSWTALKDFEFPLPPLDEQKRIAEILWAADETVNAFTSSLSVIQQSRNALLNELAAKEHPQMPLGQVLTYASDGPFGSKLVSVTSFL
jgi:type I restriction enzyme S subunit